MARIAGTQGGSGGSTPSGPTGGTGAGLNNQTCNSGVQVGDAVYMDGSNILQQALATNSIFAKVIGVVTNKASATVCSILFDGITDAIYSGLSVNSEYWLSATSAGGITATPPNISEPAGGGNSQIIVGQAYSSTRLVVRRLNLTYGETLL